MPSFLSRVFGGKKDDDKKERRLSAPSALLEGKFEAVSPTVSPSAENFTVPLPEKDKDKGLLKTFSRVQDKEKEKEKPSDLPPHLSLNLSDTRNLSTLNEVFRGAVLSDDELHNKTLSVDECLSLVKVCAGIIALHGLETPGIMHPHWHSASPESQQRLISSFFASSDWQANFRHESNMHDIAAVFRWAFRHLSLGSSSFGNAQDWYTSFSTSERQKSYPQKAYSSILRPLVPDTNMELLQVTLSLFSSLASHAERNATSASRLSKVLGFWLLDTQTPQGTWEELYSRWERSGRILEHLFLASIRDEAASSSYPMPQRLIELVKGYPYAKEETLDDLLPRPRFSTRKYTALYVNVTTEAYSPPLAPDPALARKKKSKAKPTSPPESKKKEGYDALEILTEALTTPNSITSSDAELWNALRSSYSSSLGSLFADETVRLLTLASPSVAAGAGAAPKELAVIHSPSEEGGTHRRSFSLDTPPKQSSSRIDTNGTNSPTSAIGVDWTQFSTSGFLDSPVTGSGLAGTLLDGDIEVTTPTPSRKASKPKRVPSKTRRSLDVPPISTSLVPPAKEVKRKSQIKEVKKIEIDESFVDFFADSVMDRRSEMVQFVIAKLRSEVVKSDVEWVVVERKFGDGSKPKLAEDEQIEPESGKVSPKKEKEEKRLKDIIQLKTPTKSTDKEKEKEKTSPTSPKSLDTILSSTKKRFTFFSPSKSSKEFNKESSEKKDNVKVGEMGEILREEDESEKEDKDISIPASGTAAVVAAAVAATVVPEVVDAKMTKEPETKAENGIVDQVPAEPTTEPLAAESVESKAENGVAEHNEPTIDATPEPATVETVQAKPENGVVGHEEKATNEPQVQLVPTTEVKVPEAEVVDGVPISPKTEEVVHEVVRSEDQVSESRKPQAEPQVQLVPTTEVNVPEAEVVDGVPISPKTEEAVHGVVRSEDQLPEPRELQAEFFSQPQAEASAGLSQPEAQPQSEVGPEVPAQVEPESEVMPEASALEAAAPEPEVHQEVAVAQQELEPKSPTPAIHEVDAPVQSESAAEIESEASVPEPEPEVIEEEPIAEADIEAPVPVIEPIRDPSPSRYEEETVLLDPVPTVEAELVLAPEGAVGIPPLDAPLEEKPLVEEEDSAAPKSDEQTPPMAESVLLSGSTPGPEIALSTSESTATHEASDV